MASKNRPEPFAQGCIKIIYQYFFGALIKYKPEDLTIKEWMDLIFDHKYRDITRYAAVKDFDMPGLYRMTANVKYQGMGYRKVKTGAILYVRTNGREPDSIDVEFLGGPGQKDQVFNLTLLEWNRVAANLVEAERQKRLRPRKEK